MALVYIIYGSSSLPTLGKGNEEASGHEIVWFIINTNPCSADAVWFEL